MCASSASVSLITSAEAPGNVRFALCTGKRHAFREYIAIFVLVLGLVVFMVADASKSPDFNPIGVTLILASLLVDAAISNFQEYIFSTFNADEEELVFMSYAGGSLVLFLVCMCTGEMSSGLTYMNHHDGYSMFSSSSVIVVFAACGFCGVSCVAALTKRFGALVAVITTTARKALTLLLSFVFFPKPFGFGHFAGIILFTTGIFLKSTSKFQQTQTSILPSGISNSNIGKTLVAGADEAGIGVDTSALSR